MLHVVKNGAFLKTPVRESLIRLEKRGKQGLFDAVKVAIDEMKASGQDVDFQSVARKLGVARSTLYRNSLVRELVEKARTEKRGKVVPYSDLITVVEDLKRRVEELERKVQELSDKPIA
ncbi:DUF6262 family protein [Thermovirga lienii]|jgi:transposase-like protein|uniref:DUF6262 family protein n=1 Tax=Thermovirga lienii TaxID=336261 RepID=UPI00264B227F|nr:hypothetical protein [Thermovirga sp.]MDN5367505.1 hypothetical protein [Thermovirga sp.]